MSAPQVSPWPGLALTGPLIDSCLGTDDEGLLYPLLLYTAGSGAERNLEGAGPGWVEPGWGGAQPPLTQCGSHPLGHPRGWGASPGPLGSQRIPSPCHQLPWLGTPPTAGSPSATMYAGSQSLHALLLRALTHALSHTRKSTLSVLGSQELRRGLHFPSPHILMEVFCFFHTLGDLLRHTKGTEWECSQKTEPQLWF